MKILREARRCLLGTIIALSTAIASVAYAGGGQGVAVANEEVASGLIIKYKSEQKGLALDRRLSVMRSAAERHGVTARHFRTGALGTHVIRVDRPLTIPELEALARDMQSSDPNIEYVEPDRVMYPAFTPNDPRYNEQWHYFESIGGINAPAAWDQATGSGIVVAVIDTGYRPHPDLAANILSGYDFITDVTRANDGDGRDSNALDPGDWSTGISCGAASSTWHGTHVAGTIAAATNNSTGVAGVAFNSRILPVRVLGVCGGLISDISDGIVWAAGGSVSGVPGNPTPARVLNISLGGAGTCSATYQNAINSARSLNATIVVAAGNSNVDAANFQPANCASVITVAATNRNGAKASYSNFGSSVEISAPGGDFGTGPADAVLSTLNSGATSPGADIYQLYQGTSMATPHVSGVIALMLSKNPATTWSFIVNTLALTARPFPGTCTLCGYGIIDAGAAVGVVATPGVTPGVPTNMRSNPPQYSISGAYAIRWDAVANTTTYQVERDQDTSFTAPNYIMNTVEAPTTGIGYTGPRVPRVFYFRARACNAGSCGPWSEVISREVDCGGICP